MAKSPENIIFTAGFPVYLHGFSAIDSYIGRNASAAVRVLCGADLADLARLFDGLRYPGAAFADAAVDYGGKTWYFYCEDSGLSPSSFEGVRDMLSRRSSFKFLEFCRDCKSSHFYDPHDVYSLLRCIRNGIVYSDTNAVQWWKEINPDASVCRTLIDGAMILARYFPETSSREINAIAAGFYSLNGAAPPETEEQRLLLTGLLEAANPGPGFELLKSSGFIAAYWPELAALDDVDHSKEFHPEGNVWKHTMETLRYRKAGAHGTISPDPGPGFDLRLSLGLLLHDIGKPLSQAAGSRRFDGHAELGERQARRFLERLGFNGPLVHDVCYLVRNHMLPAALPRLPLVRTGEIMDSSLFPALLELYRCDESSSFKGLDGYYESSAAYKSYLKYRRNPYRNVMANYPRQ